LKAETCEHADSIMSATAMAVAVTVETFAIWTARISGGARLLGIGIG
jgi:hypothetical protein